MSVPHEMQSPHSGATTGGNCNCNATVNASSKTPLEQKRCLQVANSDADVVFFLRWLQLQISAYHMLYELMDGHKRLQSKTIGFNYKNVPLPIRPRSATEPYGDATEYARERCQYLIDSVVDDITIIVVIIIFFTVSCTSPSRGLVGIGVRLKRISHKMLHLIEV